MLTSVHFAAGRLRRRAAGACSGGALPLEAHDDDDAAVVNAHFLLLQFVYTLLYFGIISASFQMH
jgi:hypothetical protein